MRYRRGRESAEGFWRDAFDYERFRTEVLEPFAPGASRRYRPVGHDLITDAVLDGPWLEAEPGSVVIVDGLFLLRDEIAPAWDLTVFLDVPPAVSGSRMVVRDGADPSRLGRYAEAQLLYDRACSPRDRASFVIDNRDVTRPRIRAGR